jgi:hypothetical protein
MTNTSAIKVDVFIIAFRLAGLRFLSLAYSPAQVFDDSNQFRKCRIRYGLSGPFYRVVKKSDRGLQF